MKVLPLAYDSFGVRSMCTFVSFENFGILIDPGVALGPTRYGLKPTKEEQKALEICRKKIMEVAKQANLLIVTHYHYDHHPYPHDKQMYENCFKNKLVLAKDRNKNINFSGRKRGKIFEDNVKDLVKSIEWADERKFSFNGIRVEVSPAVWHGDVGSKVGKVIMVYLERGKDSLLFGSDAQNFADPQALEWVIKKNPKFLIIDGYPTIFVGWKLAQTLFKKSKENLKKVIRETEAKTIIFDHHILRDIDYKKKMEDVYALAKELNKKILSAAEFYGLENFFLEAWRKEIHRKKRKVDVESYFKKLFDRVDEKLWKK